MAETRNNWVLPFMATIFAMMTMQMSSLGFAIRMNTLKVGTSRMLIEVVGQALTICGIAGYKNDSKISVTRHLRDAHGAELMVANDRILSANASMLLVYKDD